MANTDVRIKEIQLLEAYSETYKRFMEASINMTFRFHTAFQRKDDEAARYASTISTLVHRIYQSMVKAKVKVEASQKKTGSSDDGNELYYRQKTYLKYKELYQRARQYEESSKKLQQKVHAEVERVLQMNRFLRNKLEINKEDGERFLNKAITILNNYKQENG